MKEINQLLITWTPTTNLKYLMYLTWEHSVWASLVLVLMPTVLPLHRESANKQSCPIGTPGGFAYFQTNYFNLIECRFLRWVQSGPVPHQCFGIIHKSQRHVKLMDQRIHKECAKLNKVRQKVKLVNWLEILLLLFNGSLFTNWGIREAFWIQLMSEPNLFWPNGLLHE